MSPEYEIIFRKLDDYTSIHNSFVLGIEPHFDIDDCYFININFHPEYRTILHDGYHIVELPESLSGVGLTFSERVTPDDTVIDSIHKHLFF